MTDTQPRYTTKRMYDEIAKARLYGQQLAFEQAAKIADEHAADFERQAGGKDDPHTHDALLFAADACELTADAIRAALSSALTPTEQQASTPAPQLISVGVKPLEWIENQSWKHAKTPFGAIYTARPCLATNFLGKWLLSLEIERIGPLHDSEDAAKAAAQADYEARIRAALTATANTQNPLSSTNGEIGETRQAPAELLVGNRPTGHCDDDEAWRQFSDVYRAKYRYELCKGDLSDFALANAQFMCDRNSLDLIVYQTAAKERIRWLSIQLARALRALEAKR